MYLEVTETYHTKEEVPVTQRKTLCYDRISGSSVVIETQSNLVQLDVYCLATKYSFFSMNFAFIQKPGNWNMFFISKISLKVLDQLCNFHSTPIHILQCHTRSRNKGLLAALNGCKSMSQAGRMTSTVLSIFKSSGGRGHWYTLCEAKEEKLHLHFAYLWTMVPMWYYWKIVSYYVNSNIVLG